MAMMLLLFVYRTWMFTRCLMYISKVQLHKAGLPIGTTIRTYFISFHNVNKYKSTHANPDQKRNSIKLISLVQSSNPHFIRAAIFWFNYMIKSHSVFSRSAIFGWCCAWDKKSWTIRAQGTGNRLLKTL